MGRINKEQTPMSIEITVTERDPSNVQKLLEETAADVDKDKILRLF